MKIHEATETAYKNGYEKGKQDAVKHGRCEYCKDGKSFIGARLILGNDGEWHEINYCPECGARMDGDGNA